MPLYEKTPLEAKRNIFIAALYRYRVAALNEEKKAHDPESGADRIALLHVASENFKAALSFALNKVEQVLDPHVDPMLFEEQNDFRDWLMSERGKIHALHMIPLVESTLENNILYLRKYELGLLQYIVLDANGRRQTGYITKEDIAAQLLPDDLQRFIRICSTDVIEIDHLKEFIPMLLSVTRRNQHTPEIRGMIPGAIASLAMRFKTCGLHKECNELMSFLQETLGRIDAIFQVPERPLADENFHEDRARIELDHSYGVLHARLAFDDRPSASVIKKISQKHIDLLCSFIRTLVGVDKQRLLIKYKISSLGLSSDVEEKSSVVSVPQNADEQSAHFKWIKKHYDLLFVETQSEVLLEHWELFQTAIARVRNVEERQQYLSQQVENSISLSFQWAQMNFLEQLEQRAKELINRIKESFNAQRENAPGILARMGKFLLELVGGALGIILSPIALPILWVGKKAGSQKCANALEFYLNHTVKSGTAWFGLLLLSLAVTGVGLAAVLEAVPVGMGLAIAMESIGGAVGIALASSTITAIVVHRAYMEGLTEQERTSLRDLQLRNAQDKAINFKKLEDNLNRQRAIAKREKDPKFLAKINTLFEEQNEEERTCVKKEEQAVDDTSSHNENFLDDVISRMSLVEAEESVVDLERHKEVLLEDCRTSKENISELEQSLRQGSVAIEELRRKQVELDTIFLTKQKKIIACARLKSELEEEGLEGMQGLQEEILRLESFPILGKSDRVKLDKFKSLRAFSDHVVTTTLLNASGSNCLSDDVAAWERDLIVLQNFATGQQDIDFQPIDGNGNCFFASIAMSLNAQRGTALSAQDIRTAAVSYLKSYPAFCENAGFGPGEELGTFDEYLQRMGRDGAWAVGPIVDATAKHYNLHIQIIDFRVRKQPYRFAINEPTTDQEKAENRTVCILSRTGEDRGMQHYSVFLSKPMTRMKTTEASVASSAQFFSLPSSSSSSSAPSAAGLFSQSSATVASAASPNTTYGPLLEMSLEDLRDEQSRLQAQIVQVQSQKKNGRFLIAMLDDVEAEIKKRSHSP